MIEQYKKLNGFSKYRIYSDGRVFSEFINRFITPTDDGKGYLQVTLVNDLSKRICIKSHILVAKCWVDNPNNYKEINHKDKNKYNNNYINLEWCNRSYNVSFSSLENQLSKQKALSPMTEDMVKLIPVLLQYHLSIKLISQLYKVGHITIRNVIRHKTWRNLNLTIPKTYYNKGIIELPSIIYDTLKTFNIDNTVLSSRIKRIELV